MKNPRTIVKLPIKTESQEAEALAAYLYLLQRQGRILLYSHIPHETFTRYWNVKMKNVREGVRPGVPDYIIVTQKQVVFIELKRTRGSAVSAEQEQWIGSLQGKTIDASVCRGFEEARIYLNKFL